MKRTDARPSGAPRLWTRDYALVLGSTLLVWASYYGLMVVMPLYATEVLGGNRAQVGLLSSILALSSVPARLAGGWACDRWGRRPVQLAFLALFVLAAFSYPLAATFPLLLLLRFLHGVPFGGGTTANMTVGSDLVPAERRGEGMGYYAASQVMAYAVGPPLAFFVLARSGFDGFFTVAGLLAAGSLLLGWLIHQPRVSDPTARFRLSAVLEKRVLWMSLMGLFIALGYSGLVTFATLYAGQVGVSNAGPFFTLYALSVLAVRPLVGKLFDRHGPSLPVLAGLAGMMAGFVLLTCWRSPLGFHLSAVLYGLSYGACFPSLQAMAVAVVEPERRGAAGATLFAIFDVGMTIGPYANGLLADTRGGYPLVFLTGAAVLVVAVLLYLTRVRAEYEAQRR